MNSRTHIYPTVLTDGDGHVTINFDGLSYGSAIGAERLVCVDAVVGLKETLTSLRRGSCWYQETRE
jgi:hypothetical protein